MGEGEDRARKTVKDNVEEANKCIISNASQKEVTGVSEQQLNCENAGHLQELAQGAQQKL